MTKEQFLGLVSNLVACAYIEIQPNAHPRAVHNTRRAKDEVLDACEDQQFEIERLRAELTYAYEAGWRTAADWAKRDDLYADISSPAYERDKANALVRAPEPGDGNG
jgi:hypothetical protein